VKFAIFTCCKPKPSAYFTCNLRNSSFSDALQTFTSRKRRAENYKNGREDPTFSASIRPKSF